MFSFLKSSDCVYHQSPISIHLKNIQDLDQKNIFNWDKNRPPDKVRISQLQNFYETNNLKLVPGIVSIWVFNNKEFVYDGIHRLFSAFLCKHPMKVFIQYYYTDKEQDIINDFMAINKSISVPTIYLEEGNYIKKNVCLSVTDYLCEKYPKFVSPSRKPFRYNFNRDNLIEFFSDLDIDFTKTSVDKIIKNELNGLNMRAQEFVIRNNISCPNKCNYYGFWLFYLDKYLIKSTIEQAINTF